MFYHTSHIQIWLLDELSHVFLDPVDVCTIWYNLHESTHTVFVLYASVSVIEVC